MPKCKDCEWFDTCDDGKENPKEYRGVCRRKAPSPITFLEEDKNDNAWADDDFIFCHVGWPIVYKTDICGEFQPKDIKCFADLPPGIQRNINNLSSYPNGTIDEVEKTKRAATGVCIGVAGVPGSRAIG